MMNIPVRIFDKTLKVMLYPEELVAQGIFLSAHGEPVQMQNGVFQRLGNVIVMHRTPHMDDGKQFMWEGDICDMMVPNEYGSQTPARGFMHMDDELQKWNLEIVCPKIPMNAGLHIPTMVKRVGNVYEHAQLLKESPTITPPKP